MVAPSRPRRVASLPAWTRSLVAGLALAASLPAAAEPRDDARRHYMAGIEAANQQDFETALQEFLLAQSLFPHPSNLYSIGLSYTRMGRQVDAADYFGQALDAGLDPKPRPLIYIAGAYAGAGRVPEAIALYERVAAVDPSLAAQVEPMIASLTEQQQPVGAPGAAAASATSAELERLQAIAAELAALGEALATRGAEDAPAAPAAAAAAPAAQPMDAPLPDEDAFDRRTGRVLLERLELARTIEHLADGLELELAAREQRSDRSDHVAAVERPPHGADGNTLEIDDPGFAAIGEHVRQHAVVRRDEGVTIPLGNEDRLLRARPRVDDDAGPERVSCLSGAHLLVPG